MDLYTAMSYELSRKLTLRYSTSFGTSSRLFSKSIQPHIYAIYGLVRIADEIVDTYDGPEKEKLLAALEEDTYTAIKSGYSTNPIIHAFALTAAVYGISKILIKPFFDSMRMDLSPQHYTPALYQKYIYGSAEVIGLMCLRVFVEGDAALYKKLEPGARALGSAYQKVNFLRDIASDYQERGRVYFPNTTFETFDDTAKDEIIENIEAEFHTARLAVSQLPKNSQRAVDLSFRYYRELLKKLKKTPAATIKNTRVRLPNSKKAALLISLPLTSRGTHS